MIGLESAIRNISIHAFDATYRKFLSHSNNCSNINLVYIVKDHHLCPIIDNKLKLIARKVNQGGCNNLLKHMNDLKWTRRYENMTKIKTVDDIIDLHKENNIIILPDDMKVNTAINSYVNNSNMYIEDLHWNNRGVPDGFVDCNKNMYLLNED